jgi:hypothetical protein
MQPEEDPRDVADDFDWGALVAFIVCIVAIGFAFTLGFNGCL